MARRRASLRGATPARAARSRRMSPAHGHDGHGDDGATNTPKTTSNAALTPGPRHVPGGARGTPVPVTSMTIPGYRGHPPASGGSDTAVSASPGRRDGPASIHPWGIVAPCAGRGVRRRPRPVPAPVLRRLRGDGVPRPAVDPGLAGGLRDWLEDGLVEAVDAARDGADSVRVNKESLNQVLVCEAHLVRAPPGRPGGPRSWRGAAWWTPCSASGSPPGASTTRGTTPWPPSTSRAIATGSPPSSRASDGRRRRRADGRRSPSTLRRLMADWGRSPSPAWLPRTQERLEVPLCGGRVVLAGVVDLVLGSPAQDRASVCLVELKSGPRRLEHRGDLHFYALARGAAQRRPARSASRPTTAARASSIAEPVDEDTLVERAAGARSTGASGSVPSGGGRRAGAHAQPPVRLVCGLCPRVGRARRAPGAARPPSRQRYVRGATGDRHEANVRAPG